MDLVDKIRGIADQVPKQLAHIQTEEATKTALIMPFINALGYNVFDPSEVVPEYTADFGTKKGEKVDYAIIKDSKLIMIFEAKTVGSKLSIANSSQLFRYFTTTDVRFGILTNGIEYQFYSDLDKPNKMDDKPFLVIDLLDIKDILIEELKKFTKSAFDIDNILSSASELKYTREIKRLIAQQFSEPDEEFIRVFASKVYSGRMTPQVKDQFGTVIKQAFKQFINDRISNRLQTALSAETTVIDESPAIMNNDNQSNQQPEEKIEDTSPQRQIITTQTELEGYFLIKFLLREVIDTKRIIIRDTQSYCGILLDDNNRKPICRLHFNRSQKYIGLFSQDKTEERVAINEVDDIYQFADRLKSIVKFYDSE